MRFIPLLILAVGLLAPECVMAQAGCQYDAGLNGAEVVPPTGSSGYCRIVSWFEPELAPCEGADPPVLYVQVQSYRDLMGAATGLYVGRGPVGGNGEITYTIFNELFEPGDETTIAFDQDADCDDLFYEGLYIILTTDAFPEGELRGQIIPDCWSPVHEGTWGRIRMGYR